MRNNIHFEQKRKPTAYGKLSFSYVVRSALLDSTGGAGVNAATAVDAGVSVDDILGVALRDSANGAAIGTSAAVQASVSNHISHGNTPPLFYAGFTACTV